MLLSRHPILSAHSYRLTPRNPKACLMAELDVFGSKLLLFNVHLKAGPVRQFSNMRIEEQRAILTQIEHVAPRHCIVMGDFNVKHVHDERAVALDQAGFVDAWERRDNADPSDPGFTYDIVK